MYQKVEKNQEAPIEKDLRSEGAEASARIVREQTDPALARTTSTARLEGPHANAPAEPVGRTTPTSDVQADIRGGASAGDMDRISKDLNVLKQRESPEAFQDDMKRINDDLHKHGILPNLKLVEGKDGKFDIAPDMEAATSQKGDKPPEYPPMSDAGGGGGCQLENGQPGHDRPHRRAWHGGHHGAEGRHHRGGRHGHGRGGRGHHRRGHHYRGGGESERQAGAQQGGESTQGGERPEAGTRRSHTAAGEVSESQKRESANLVAGIAKEMGVDPKTAVAAMLVESQGDPRNRGDGNTSFGLFQLHRGGELGNMSVEQAFNPELNTRRALQEFQKTQGRHGSPGADAAAAQNPRNKTAYAHKVNRALAEAEELLRT